MNRANTITNPITGQQLVFLQSGAPDGSGPLRIESRFPGRSKEPVPHYHPRQHETFLVTEGQLTVRLKNEVRVLKAGDTIAISPKTVHSMWNDTDQPATVQWTIEPALNTEAFFRTVFDLAHAGKVNADGIPDLLRVSIITGLYENEYRVVKPPYAVQRVLFGALRPIARLCGYGEDCHKYLSSARL